MKKKIEIELGTSFWVGISFAAGCFGFGWWPFVIVMLLGLFRGINETKTQH